MMKWLQIKENLKAEKKVTHRTKIVAQISEKGYDLLLGRI